MNHLRLRDEAWEARAARFVDTSRAPDALWRQDCVICFDELGRGRILFRPGGCMHILHDTCARTWARKGEPKCPTCRAAFFVDGGLGCGGNSKTGEDSV